MSHRRIDVHHHVLPPAYTAWLRSKGIEEGGGRALPSWSVDETLRLMDDNDIATGILSVSTPGVHLDASRRRDPVTCATPPATPASIGGTPRCSSRSSPRDSGPSR
jgi:hypothetical protein